MVTTRIDTTEKARQGTDHAFHHPHGILLAKDGSLYVVQDASNNTWPMKFVPVE